MLEAHQADPRHLLTERLQLDAVQRSDLDALHALHADPRTWEHLPSGRSEDRGASERLVMRFVGDWTAHGVGYWTVRLRKPDGRLAPVIGVGGCALRPELAWNVYYRFTPEAWGNGYAQELVAAARAMAAAHDPTLPVVAFLLEHNVASKRTAQRCGFQLVWRGPDAGSPDPQAIRLIYADRDLTAEALSVLTAQ